MTTIFLQVVGLYLLRQQLHYLRYSHNLDHLFESYCYTHIHTYIFQPQKPFIFFMRIKICSDFQKIAKN